MDALIVLDRLFDVTFIGCSEKGLESLQNALSNVGIDDISLSSENLFSFLNSVSQFHSVLLGSQQVLRYSLANPYRSVELPGANGFTCRFDKVR